MTYMFFVCTIAFESRNNSWALKSSSSTSIKEGYWDKTDDRLMMVIRYLRETLNKLFSKIYYFLGPLRYHPKKIIK